VDGLTGTAPVEIAGVVAALFPPSAAPANAADRTKDATMSIDGVMRLDADLFPRTPPMDNPPGVRERGAAAG
jgi:hypothetical protein